ncbi:hypothetical protein BD309DRAFT_697731 [Dichomitus squalens]|nr:hypothetical protein BD309DRAFT_697731 [Dichomitus squalens]
MESSWKRRTFSSVGECGGNVGRTWRQCAHSPLVLLPPKSGTSRCGRDASCEDIAEGSKVVPARASTTPAPRRLGGRCPPAVPLHRQVSNREPIVDVERKTPCSLAAEAENAPAECNTNILASPPISRHQSSTGSATTTQSVTNGVIEDDGDLCARGPGPCPRAGRQLARLDSRRRDSLHATILALQGSSLRAALQAWQHKHPADTRH